VYRASIVGPLDVQRAADSLLRQGRKPSVAAIREHLGGGSPNTITPMLSKYWAELGARLGEGPEALQHVPESLARVTELLWRRALEEARERLKLQQSPDIRSNAEQTLRLQLEKLSVALAEARAREGEQWTHLARLSKEREEWQAERQRLQSLLKSSQQLLEQQADRIRQLEQLRTSLSRRMVAAAMPPRRKSPQRRTARSATRTPARRGRLASKRRG